MNEDRSDILQAAAAAHPAFAGTAQATPRDLLALAAWVGEGLTEVDLPLLQRQIGFLAYLVERAAEGSQDPRRRLAALRQVLAEEEGLSGAGDPSDEPANSFLNRVLEQRQGLPIALAVIYLAVAERLHWPLAGVDYPAHFLLRYRESSELLVIDPLQGGELIPYERCVELAAPLFKDLPTRELSLYLRIRLEDIVTPERLVTRMLRNLEGSFAARRDLAALRNVVQKLLLVDPTADRELCTLAQVHHLLGDHRQAVACLRGYLERQPEGPDRRRAEQMVHRWSELLDEE
ncbi:MAG: transglutaminase family protein [Fimbriimonadaceae bacterium]|nr:transglutaminase family protein [Fimbriimonadaceae bacterium]